MFRGFASLRACCTPVRPLAIIIVAACVLSGIHSFAPAVSAQTQGAGNGAVLISEFRFSGSAPSAATQPGNEQGERDEYIELYNNSTSARDITGYQVETSSGVTLTVASAQGGVRVVLPARGHYLFANAGGYSLNVTPDQTYGTPDAPVDIPVNSGVRVRNPAGQITDAVGFTTSPAAFRESTGIRPLTLPNDGMGEYAFFRRMETGVPRDAGNNRGDFLFVATDAGRYGRPGNPGTPDGPAILGAPGPENMMSPVARTRELVVAPLNPDQPDSSPDNRTTTGTPPNRETILRRRLTNTSGRNFSRVRLRVADITTLNSTPPSTVARTSDLRVRTSDPDAVVTITRANGDTETFTLEQTRLEQVSTDPTRFYTESGLNATLELDRGIATGETIGVQIKLRVERAGDLRFALTAEALEGTAAPMQQTLIFFDFFLFDNGGQPAQNFNAFFQWDVTDGTVDLLGGNVPGADDDRNGRFVELGGSTGNPGRFATRQQFVFMPGTVYNLRFDYKSSDGNPNSALVTLGTRQFTVSTSSTEFETFNQNITFDQPTTANLVFQDLGTDNFGIGIDRVTLSTPTPGSPNP